MKIKLILLATLLQFGRCKPVAGFPLQYKVGQTYHYAYTTETTIQEGASLSSLGGDSRANNNGKQVGFRFSATIEMTPVWASNQNLLVKLSIHKPSLHSVARPDVSKQLRALPRLPIYFQWDSGKVGRVFASEDDSTLAVNIKKGVISMFQLSVDQGNHEEMDSSGECQVSYTKEGNIIKRIKTSCQNIETAGQLFTVNPVMSVERDYSSSVTYHLSDDLIQTATGVEEHTVKSNLEQSVSTRIKTRQDIKITNTSKGKSIQGDSLDKVIQKINKGEKSELYGMVLATSFEPSTCSSDNFSLAEKIDELREKLSPKKAASFDATSTFLELVDTFRDCSKDDLLALLQDKTNEPVIGALIDAMVAAQTTAGQEALMEYLKFDDYYYIDKPERYLLATAFVTHPSDKLLEDLVEIYNKDITNEKLEESVGGALGSVLYTYCRVGDQCQSKLAKQTLKMILDRLDNCEKENCKPRALRALTNAGVDETIPYILKYAETSKDSKISEAAIKALRRMGKQNINKEVKDTMRRIFLQKSQGYDTAVRSQALKILLENDPTQEDIQSILLESTDPHNTEYDLYVQSRVFNLMQANPDVEAMVKEVLKDTNISNWHILAPKGKSLAFTNSMGETPSFTTTYFMFTENARSGIVKRSGMDVDLFSPKQTMPVYNFLMFAAGMEGLLGEEVEEGQKDVQPTAGMSLDLMDVSLRPITFFTGQSGLMSAVWNAPSQLTSALQANILLTDHLERIHLQNGLIVEAEVLAALSVDMSGSLSVSLWNKNAKSLVKNSGSVLIRSKAHIKTSSFRSGVDVATDTSSVIDFSSDVDFYDGVKTCLQMGRPESRLRQEVTRYERARGFPTRYTSRTQRTRKVNALSYPLPRLNNKQCRALLGSS